MRPAISTPRPLPRERESAKKRGALGQLRSIPSRTSNHDDKRNRLAPVKTIQKDDAPLARRTAIQSKESESKTRLAASARIDALRVEIRELVEAVALTADIELLDLMRDEVGSYRRHKAAQEARTWAGAAGIQLETGLMMLDRALQPTSI